MTQKVLWNIVKKECWRMEEPCPEKTEICSVKPSHARKNILNSWLRENAEGKEKERKRVNEEPKREESKSGKREVEGESERVEIRRRCLDRVSSEVFEDFGPTSEVESVGDSFGFSVCVCLLFVPSSMPVVTILLSNVNVVCVVLSSDSEL